MTEAQIVALTAELRTSGTPSLQDQIGPGNWKVTAQSPTQTSAVTIKDIATRHLIAAESNRAEFRGTLAQCNGVAQDLQASKISIFMDYEGDGTTDAWVVRAVSGTVYSIDAILSLANNRGTAASTNRAVFK